MCWRAGEAVAISSPSPSSAVSWRAAGYAVRRGQIDAAFGMGFVSHHLIQFTREALRGEQNASFYSTHERERAQAA